MIKLKNYSDNEALAIIDEVVGKIAKNFTFGYFDEDDIAQEGRILALNAINSGAYDESRPLKNFLFVFLRNRFINLKRDKYYRATPPCNACPFFDKNLKCSLNACTAFEDKMECDKFNVWTTLNASKRNLIDPIDIDSVDMEGEKSMLELVYTEETQEKNEMGTYIDERLPLDMRADYLKLLSNYGVRHSHKVKIATARVREIQTVVSGIMEDFYANRT
jgi:hypothetical protein